MCKGLLAGFEKQYEIDEEDEKFLDSELKYFTDNKFKTKVMHFVYMELFFIVLEAIEKVRLKLVTITEEILEA